MSEPIARHEHGQDGSPPGDADGVGPFEPPFTLRTAVLLMYAGAAAVVVSLVVSMLYLDTTLKDALGTSEIADDLMVQARIDQRKHFPIVAGVVLAAIQVVLWLWMAAANRRGRSWARFLATVMAGLYIFATVISLARDTDYVIPTFMSVVSLGIAVWALACLYQPESSRYYPAVSARRR